MRDPWAASIEQPSKVRNGLVKGFDHALLGVHLRGHEARLLAEEGASLRDQVSSLIRQFRATHKASLNWYDDVDAYVASS